jgi:hypothetical protein
MQLDYRLPMHQCLFAICLYIYIKKNIEILFNVSARFTVCPADKHNDILMQKIVGLRGNGRICLFTFDKVFIYYPMLKLLF